MLSYLAGVVHSFEKNSRGIPRSIRGPSFDSTGLRLGHSGSPERHGDPRLIGPCTHRCAVLPVSLSSCVARIESD